MSFEVKLFLCPSFLPLRFGNSITVGLLLSCVCVSASVFALALSMPCNLLFSQYLSGGGSYLSPFLFNGGNQIQIEPPRSR